MDWRFSLRNCNAVSFAIGIGGILLFIYILKFRKPRNYPPGPLGLPFVGYTPFFGKNAAESLRQLKAKYGPVISVQIGSEDWVVLNGYEVINEALVKEGDKFSGRSPNPIFRFVTRGYGLVCADYGPIFKNLSKFGHIVLRNFGVGKKGIEEKVAEEMIYLVDNLLKDEKGSVSTKLTLATSNIICGIALGRRFSYDDPKFLEMDRVLRGFLSSSLDAKLFGVLSMSPSLRYFPPFSGVFKKRMADMKNFLGEFRKIIDEHKKRFDENDIRDFIDAFLKEMNDRGDGDPSFCDEQLLQYIRDLFEAGSGTSSSTLAWALLCFANYPEHQEKIANEAENVVGQSGIPSMRHRDEMPFTCAFIHELTRHRTLVPLSVTHKTNAEASLCGYTIPKNTIISPNIWSVHMDPELFDNPEEFRPERFLGKDGKFMKSNHVIPFSLGSRRCLGEQLARVELFVFLVGMVQRVEVLSDPENPPPPFETIDLANGFSLEPPEFSVKLKRR